MKEFAAFPWHHKIVIYLDISYEAEPQIFRQYRDIYKYYFKYANSK